MKLKTRLLFILIIFLAAALPVGAENLPWIEHLTVSGMKVLLQRTGSELLEVSLLLKSGSGLDRESQQGAALVMNSLVNIKLGDEKDEYADITLNTYPDYTVINFATTKSELTRVLREVRELLTLPLYNYDIITDLKDLYSTDLRAASPWAKAYQKFGECFYGPEHPYNEQLEPEMLKKVGGEAIYRWYRKTYQPGNAILSIAGGTKLRMKKIAKYFRKMDNETVDLRLMLEPVLLDRDQQLQFEDPNGRIATFCMGYPAPRVQDHEYPAFRVINYYLENFQHYFEEVRVKRGLMYTGFVYYNYLEKPRAPAIVFMAMTDQDNLAKVETETVAVVQHLITDGIAQSQIDLVVKTMKADADNRALAGEGVAYRNALCEYLQTSLLYDSTALDLLAKVTTADIKQAAAKYLQHYVRVAYVPSKQATDLHHRAGDLPAAPTPEQKEESLPLSP
ncbi:MAG: insulinase family protein [Bacillota bacterium]|jgi:predicted Zn-dependent peptidase